MRIYSCTTKNYSNNTNTQNQLRVLLVLQMRLILFDKTSFVYGMLWTNYRIRISDAFNVLGSHDEIFVFYK